MKFTKTQLKQIIKEELDAVMDEGDRAGASGGEYVRGRRPHRLDHDYFDVMTPKRVFFDVIMPALESAGFTGMHAMKMARDAVDAAFEMGAQMMGEQDENHKEST